MQCPECYGTGYVERVSVADNMEVDQFICATCNGSGDIKGNSILSIGKQVAPGWYNIKFDKVFLDKRGIKVTLAKKEDSVLKREDLEANKFYIGSNSIFQRGRKGWGHPTEAEAVEHAQRMLSDNPDAGEVFIVEIIKVVRRKPVDVDIEEI